MIVVADASVAVCALGSDPRTEQASRLFTMAGTVHAPELIVAEVANAGWRLVRAGDAPSEYVQDLLGTLPAVVDELHPLLPLAQRAAEIARTLDHPVYDCFYLALAERLGCPLATFDRRLLARLDGTPFEGRVRLPEQISDA